MSKRINNKSVTVIIILSALCISESWLLWHIYSLPSGISVPEGFEVKRKGNGYTVKQKANSESSPPRLEARKVARKPPISPAPPIMGGAVFIPFPPDPPHFFRVGVLAGSILGLELSYGYKPFKFFSVEFGAFGGYSPFTLHPHFGVIGAMTFYFGSKK